MPWREVGPDGRRDAYRSLVSEIMLQQTQVSRVLEKFEPFLERFPTLEALANADEDEVLTMWSGLGYYRRARSLHACARQAVERFGGLPERASDLETLTGLGRYTAGAIASIVHHEPVPIVDGNVERVLLRLEGKPLQAGQTKTRNWCWGRSAELVKKAEGSRSVGVGVAGFNEGLMELGAVVCIPKSPDCGACPVRALCRARHMGTQDAIPLPKSRTTKKPLFLACLFVQNPDGLVLLEQRPKGGLWGGLWQVPTLESDTRVSKARVAEYFGVATTDLFGHTPFTHETTHRSVRVAVYGSRRIPTVTTDGRWIEPAGFGELALGSLQRRVLESGPTARAQV